MQTKERLAGRRHEVLDKRMRAYEGQLYILYHEVKNHIESSLMIKNSLFGYVYEIQCILSIRHNTSAR